jgi:hypothetical protein
MPATPTSPAALTSMITAVARREINKAKAPSLAAVLVEIVPDLSARIMENDFFDSDTVIVTGTSTAEVRVLSNRVATRDRSVRDKIAAALPAYHGLIDARDTYPWYFIVLSPSSGIVEPPGRLPTCPTHHLVLPATGRCDYC